MLSGPPDTAMPNRAVSSPSTSARTASRSASGRWEGASSGTSIGSNAALGLGPALVHHAAQAARQGRTIDLFQLRIDLAGICRLLQLDQRLAQIGQAVGGALATRALLVIFVEGDRRQRRLAIVQIGAAQQVGGAAADRPVAIFVDSRLELGLRLGIEFRVPQTETIAIGIARRIAGIMRFEKAKSAFLERTQNLPSLSRFVGRLRYPVA